MRDPKLLESRLSYTSREIARCSSLVIRLALELILRFWPVQNGLMPVESARFATEASS